MNKNNSPAKTLREIIKEKGLQYKIVADMAGCPTERVCSDAGLQRLSAERTIVYCRVLKIDPAELRPDVFHPGEFILNG